MQICCGCQKNSIKQQAKNITIITTGAMFSKSFSLSRYCVHPQCQFEYLKNWHTVTAYRSYF